jgi:predicted  nucleic acid-binding Zn-ribbon protein
MDRLAKKKLIQKVRNRMSAQRSRMRKGIHYKIIEHQNKNLKMEIENFMRMNHQLRMEIDSLQFKNQNLQKKIKSIESSACPKWLIDTI